MYLIIEYVLNHFYQYHILIHIVKKINLTIEQKDDKKEQKEVKKEDEERYQTIFASVEGAVAAPTAGLHFSRELMKRLELKGVDFAELDSDMILAALKEVNRQLPPLVPQVNKPRYSSKNDTTNPTGKEMTS